MDGGSFLTLIANNYSADNSELAGSAMGRFTGIFFAVFQVNTVVGNMIGAFVLSRHHNQHTLFFIFLAIAGAGVALLFVLVSPPSDKTQKTDTDKHESVLGKLLSVLLLLRSKEMLLCVPTLFFSGIQAGTNSNSLRLRLTP